MKRQSNLRVEMRERKKKKNSDPPFVDTPPITINRSLNLQAVLWKRFPHDVQVTLFSVVRIIGVTRLFL